LHKRSQTTYGPEIIPNTLGGPRTPGDPEYTGIHPPGDDDPGRPQQYEEGPFVVEPLSDPGGTTRDYPDPEDETEPYARDQSPDADVPRPI